MGGGSFIRVLRRRGPSDARRRGGRIVGAIAGVLLLVAAVWALWSQRTVLDEAVGSLRDAPAWLIATAFLMPLVSWVSTSVTFWLLSERYARVPVSDMTQLIGAAWLLNHLPLRPGMIGRVAFHRRYHGMTVAQCVRVMIVAMALSGVSLGLLLVAAVGAARFEGIGVRIACLSVPTAAIVVAAVASRVAGASWWREAAALAARSVDMLSWVGRYAIVFALIGEPLSLGQIVAVAAVCQVATIVPVTGNGLGLREWAVGLTVALFADAGLREQAAAVGLAADLVNRAAETLLVVPVGLACSAMLARKVRRARGG